MRPLCHRLSLPLGGVARGMQIALLGAETCLLPPLAKWGMGGFEDVRESPSLPLFQRGIPRELVFKAFETVCVEAKQGGGPKKQRRRHAGRNLRGSERALAGGDDR